MIYYESNYLCHYGLKGMKWGVRRWQNEDGSLTANGKRRYSRMFSDRDTYERVKAIRDSGRVKYMSARQKKSLNNAEQYWKARVEGKNPEIKRGLIKRQADRYRSYSVKARAGQMAAIGLIKTFRYAAISTIVDGPASGAAAAGKGALNTALETSGALAVNELMNRAFGHF